MKVTGKMYMYTGGALLVLLILTGSISYILPEEPGTSDRIVSGKYKLASIQDGEITYFEGSVFFEMARQYTGVKQTPVFKLHFINPESEKSSGFGFLIPLRPANPEISVTHYWVEPRGNKALNEFDTVFGYADVAGGEPALYFTEAGSISISSSSTREVAGNMNMLLKDQSGRSMHLKGRFSARPLYAEQVY